MFKKESEFKIVTDPKDEPEGASENEAESLQIRFSLALQERVAQTLPNTLKIQGSFYFVLSRVVKAQESLKTTEQLRCLRDDFELYDVLRTLTIRPNMGGMVDYDFIKLDPMKAGLSGDEAGKLVRRIIEGKE